MEAVRLEAVLMVIMPLMFGAVMGHFDWFDLPMPGYFGRDIDHEGGGREYETQYKGEWELVTENSGISAMHVQLMPNDKIIMFDATNFGPSNIKLPIGECRLNPNVVDQEDCWAHAVEFDIYTSRLRPLTVKTNTWCSSGALDKDGTLVQTGGWNDGGKAIRYFSPCSTCNWEEHTNGLAVQRWYSTQHVLPDGRMIVFGGRKQYSYEFLPPRGRPATKAIPFSFLRETTDKVIENNLYPFVYLIPDGTLFILANNRSILFDPNTEKVVHEFPVLPGGSRNYPASASSTLLPLDLNTGNTPAAEVLVCGGAPSYAASLAPQGIFPEALRSCGRLIASDRSAQWRMETMPTPRVMGDMLLLPDTNVLIINGAKKGVAGWNAAAEPNLEPLIYKPAWPEDERFVALTPSNIPRMYHSSSAVLPDCSVLVAGSNTNSKYNFTNVDFPTELRVEKLSPPYLNPTLKQRRPSVVRNYEQRELRYGERFTISIQLGEMNFSKDKEDIKVTMLMPPFTTHGISMNQRMLVLKVKDVTMVAPMAYDVVCFAPAAAEIAPAGYYLVFVVNRGIPSKGVWIRLQ